MRFKKQNRAKEAALRGCWGAGSTCCSGPKGTSKRVGAFSPGRRCGRSTASLILLISTASTVPVAPDTQPAPFDPFLYVEEQNSTLGSEKPSSRVLYINGSGCIQSYEVVGGALYRVSERFADVKAAISVLRQLLTAAKTNSFEQLPPGQRKEREANEVQIRLVFSENFLESHQKHGQRFSKQCIALLDTVRRLETKPPSTPTVAKRTYLRASSAIDEALPGKAGTPPVYDLRTASASKSIYLSRAIENPWRLISVPEGRNPFEAFVNSFTPGDSLNVKVAGKIVTVKSYPATAK